jgi:hypothetical protein
MLTGMRFGTMRRRLAAAAVPLAFAAALPLVQWCPLGTAVTLRDCLPGAVLPAAAAHAPTACPEQGGCPLRAQACGHFPLQRSTPPTRCIGAPMGGPGLRPHSPHLRPPALLPALATTSLPVVEAPREIGCIASAAEARPPTRSWARRPPVRGPPHA